MALIGLLDYQHTISFLIFPDVDYLRTVFPDTTEEDFYTFFKQLDTSEVTLMAVKEGSVVFPKEPLLVISGPLAGLNFSC